MPAQQQGMRTRICLFSKLLFITHTEAWIPVGWCSSQSAALDTVSKNTVLVPVLFPQDKQKEEVSIVCFVSLFFK